MQAGVDHCKEMLPGLPPLPQEVPALARAVQLLHQHRQAPALAASAVSGQLSFFCIAAPECTLLRLCRCVYVQTAAVIAEDQGARFQHVQSVLG